MLDENYGLEPLASLPPARHALRVHAMARVVLTLESPIWFSDANRVYFAKAASGPVKIGTSSNPKVRLRGIRSGLPEEIELLATLPGSFECERYLHGVYADERIRGEWFNPSTRLCAMIDRLRVQGPFPWNTQAQEMAQWRGL